MDLASILAGTGASTSFENLTAGWSESLASLGAPERATLLDPQATAENAAFAGLDEATTRYALDGARKIQGIPGLDLVLWHCARGLYLDVKALKLDGWPDWSNALG